MEEMPHQGGGMSLGSLMAEMAFATAGTAAVHALAYPLGESSISPMERQIRLC